MDVIEVKITPETKGEQHSLSNNPFSTAIKEILKVDAEVLCIHSSFMSITINKEPHLISIVKKEQSKFDDFLTFFDLFGIIDKEYNFHLDIPEKLKEYLK